MNEMRITIPYKPLPYQLMLHRDKHRFKVLPCGRRVGKTTYAVNELIRWAVERNLAVPFWYVAPFFYQAREIAWQMLLKYLPRELLAKKPSETDLSVKLINGATVALRGADSQWGLEGVGLGGLIVDEAASIGHFESLWQNTLRPMLTDFNSPAVFISRPRGYNHFHSLCKMGDFQNVIEGDALGINLNPDFATFRFPTEFNCRECHGGYLDHGEIQLAKAQLTPEAFAQEYEARFTHYSGLVHKPFSREVNVINDFIPPKEWRRVRAWDFGSAHPTASLRVAVDNDSNWFVEYTYKQANKSIDDHVTAIKVQDSDLGAVPQGWGDPAGRQWIREFQNKGVPILAARRDENTSERSWLQLGIDLVNSHLEPKLGHLVILPDGTKMENAPSLFILNRPENYSLIYELENLVYKETQYGINNAVIDDTRDKFGHFDLLASLRYLAVSETSHMSFYPIQQPSQEEKQKALNQKDIEIKETLKDPEKRKELEQEMDLKASREGDLQRRNEW